MTFNLITRKLKVIVYGIGNTLIQAEDYIEARFEVLACSDSDIEKSKSEYASKYKFIPPNDISRLEFDAVIITSIYDDEIKEQLIDRYCILPSQIMTRKEWCHLSVCENYVGDNVKHPYLIGRQIRVKNGLMSFLLAATEQLALIEGKGFIPVMNMKTYSNQYMEPGELGRVNTWEKYYEPLSGLSVDNVLDDPNTILGYDSPDYLINYKEDYDVAGMHHAYEKYIHIKPHVLEYINREYERSLKPYKRPLGVLARGTDMSQLKLKDHPIQPTMEEMANMTQKCCEAWGCDAIYLCTEDAKIYDFFKKNFGDKLVSANQQRFDNTGNKWIAEIEIERDNDKYLRGLEYLTTIELLGKCDNLLASLCCGTLCTQIIHGPQYENLKIVEKGFY